MYRSTLSLTLELGGGGWSTPHRGRFTPEERHPVPTVQEAGWAPRAGLDGFEESRLRRDSIPGQSNP